MDTLYEFGLEATRWLQDAYPSWESWLGFITEFGRFEFYLLFLPLIYWCINKKLGVQLFAVMAITDFTNSTLKHLLRTPRPYWLDATVGLVSDADYGLPSGHTQSATVLYLFLAGWLRRRWAYAAAVMIIFVMALSRVYLGAHFVHDILGGLFVGLAILGGFLLWRTFIDERYKTRILGQRLLVAIVVPVVFFALYIIVRLVLGAPDDGVAWVGFIDSAELLGMESSTRGFALLLAFTIGANLETSYVCFKAEGTWLQKAARYLLGMVVALLIWQGLDIAFEAVTPEGTLWLALPLRFVRYFLLAIWIVYYAPMAFVWLKLADFSPEPEIPFTVKGASTPSERK